MPTKQRYPRPPIIEAVIEIRFDGVLTAREMERVRDKFKRDFPTIEETRHVQVEIHADKIIPSATLGGFKMSAQNAIDLVVINLSNITSVRLAPY